MHNKENVPPNGRMVTWDEFTTASSPSFVVWPEDIGFDTLPLPIAHLPLETIPASLIDEEINSTSGSTSSEEEERRSSACWRWDQGGDGGRREEGKLK